VIEFDAELQRGDSRLELRFSAPSRGATVLFGPSGAGKSSVLALLAGALAPDRGRIAVDGEVLADTARGVRVPLEQRRIGWVFQDGRLFPHLRVRENLEFGLRRAPRAAPAPLDFAAIVEVLGLAALLGRWPRDLSGGERQRVAIGRALLARPRLLLLDEPLASLDAPRKAEILALLERIKRDAQVPIVYVTHSLAETLRLADHLVLLEGGRVVAEGGALELIGRGDTRGLAQRADAGSLLLATVVAHDAARATTELRVGAQHLQVPAVPLAPGAELRCYVPASDVIVATRRPEGISVRNVIAVTVSRILPRDRTAVHVELEADGLRLLATVTPGAVADLALLPGAAVYALVKSVAVDAPAGLHMLEGESV
jgi:molybdate transport system ATP-binding protein